MLKRTACLIALLVGNPLLLAGQGTETTPKPPKKESWSLVKKVKRTFVNHPIGATLGVAAAITTTAYLVITYTSTGSETPKPQTPVNEGIRVEVRFENDTYTFDNIKASSITIEGFLNKFIDQLKSSYKNPAYLYSISYNNQKINENTFKQKLDTLDIKNNAVLEISVDKQPVFITIQFGDQTPKEVTIIEADKRNNLAWLKQELHKTVNIPIVDQELYLGKNLLSNNSFRNFLNSENPTKQTLDLREKKIITLTVELEENTYTLEVATSKTLNKVITLATEQLDPLQTKAYRYDISYNGTKITGNYKRKTLAGCGIEENAQIKLIADNQPIDLIVKHGDDEPKKELKITADTRNTIGWLKKELSKRLNMNIENQDLTFIENKNLNISIEPDENEKLSTDAFSSDKGFFVLEKE